MTGTQDPNAKDISLEDLNSSDVTSIVTQMEEAKKLTMIREVGATPSASSNKNSGAIAILTLTGGGLAGGVLAFLTQKVIFSGGALDNSSTTVTNLLFTFILAFVIGMIVSITDAASSRVASKVGIAAAIAFPTSIVSGLAIGAVANSFYSAIMTNVYNTANERLGNGESEETVFNWIRNSTHLPRGAAWLMVGIAAGLTVGVASRSLKRTGLCVGGGALGGFLGGFVFDFLPLDLEWGAQLIGIGITGLFVGLSMALLEQAARTQWIEIIAGGMAGKQFILYKSDIQIGSSTQADITLIKDPAIAPIHARIFVQGGRTFIESLDPSRPCSINGRVEQRMPLQDSIDITLGATVIRFREKAGKAQAVGSVGRLS